MQHDEFATQDKDEVRIVEDTYEIRKNYYTEINQYRRHYSQLRFAVFPLYLAIQSGLLQFSFSAADNVQSCIPLEYLFSIAGILITYVFWTIEHRILSYYNHLSEIGSTLEKEYGKGYNMITKWPGNSKKGLLSRLADTNFSIRLTYLVFVSYWFITACYYLYK